MKYWTSEGARERGTQKEREKCGREREREIKRYRVREGMRDIKRYKNKIKLKVRNIHNTLLI